MGKPKYREFSVIHVLVYAVSYTSRRKILNIKKIVRFTTQKSVLHDFQALPSENCSIYDPEVSYSYTIFGCAQAKFSFMRFLVYIALSGM